MPEIKDISDHFKQLALSGGGKMILTILLVTGVIFGAIATCLWQGLFAPLEGLLKSLYIIDIWLFVASIAGSMAIVVWAKNQLTAFQIQRNRVA